MKKECKSAAAVFSTTCLMSLAQFTCAFQANGQEHVQFDAAYLAMAKEVREKGRAAFPEIIRYCSTIDCGSANHVGIMYHICCVMDGLDMQTEGAPELLTMTRSLLACQMEQHKLFANRSTEFGLVYLAQKGNVRDLPLLLQLLAEPSVTNNAYILSKVVGLPYKILQTRSAGTNIVSGLFDSKCFPAYDAFSNRAYTTNLLAFMPSVANTGPQAAYVYKAFCKAIMKHDNYMDGWPYSAVSNIPPELLTMRVWLDKGSNAVTDVDLSKYGISVPGLGLATSAPPPLVAAPSASASREDGRAKPNPAAPVRSMRPLLPVVGAVGILAALLTWLALRKRKQ